MFATSLAAADTVHQRSGLPSIEGRVIKINEAGVTVDQGLQPAVVIRLDLVRDVEMERPDPELQRFLDDGLNLWRARTRLERHDSTLAEPVFERLFEVYRGQTSEAALLVAEGLLRCRLARNANEAAVIPALESGRLRRALKDSSQVYSSLPPVLDAQSPLCTKLPPVWITSSALKKLQRELQSYDPGKDEVIQGLTAMYRRAASYFINGQIEDDDLIPAADHPAVSLLRIAIDALASDEGQRDAARRAMQKNLAAADEWAQAWIHFFCGLSGVLESDRAAHERGLVDLAYLPARFGRDQPYLAAMALAKLAQACDAGGDSAAAESLRHELLTRYPKHPASAARRQDNLLAAPAADIIKDSQ